MQLSWTSRTHNCSFCDLVTAGIYATMPNLLTLFSRHLSYQPPQISLGMFISELATLGHKEDAGWESVVLLAVSFQERTCVNLPLRAVQVVKPFQGGFPSRQRLCFQKHRLRSNTSSLWSCQVLWFRQPSDSACFGVSFNPRALPFPLYGFSLVLCSHNSCWLSIHFSLTKLEY